MAGVRVKGLEGLLAKVRKLDHILQVEVDAEMSASATTIAQNAARAAPVDEGGLRGAIKDNTTTKFKKYITVNKSYAPFVEFGTGKKVRVPTGLESYAAGFKKRRGSGDFASFVLAIEGWMKRHGITAKSFGAKSPKKRSNKTSGNKGLAYVIALKILRDGVRPQPFLFPAFFDEQPKLIKRVENLLKV